MASVGTRAQREAKLCRELQRKGGWTQSLAAAHPPCSTRLRAKLQAHGHVLTVPVSHAVEEHPVLVLGAVFHKGDVVAGLDAEHGEELHLLARDLLAAPDVPTMKLFGDVQPRCLVGFALVVGVNLRRSVRVSGDSICCRPPRWIS